MRRLRTELALLRRIRHSATRLKSPPNRTPPPWRGRYSRGERSDLRQVVRDAARPVVEEMIALIDREFPGVRKELMMSIVNEEGDNIVRDAVDAGVVVPLGRKPEAPEGVTDPATAEAVLASVEAGLADAIGEQLDAVNDTVRGVTTDPELIASNGVASEWSRGGASDAPPDEMTPVAGDSETGSDPVTAGMPTLPDAIDVPGEHQSAEAGDSSIDMSCPESASKPPSDAQLVPDVFSAPGKAEEPRTSAETNAPSPTNEALDLAYTPARAEQAVSEIEHGIQKLANILRGEVDEQWRQATNACREIAAARRDLDGVHGRAADLVEDIARLRKEAELAREGADLARREAKLFRDDAARIRMRINDTLPPGAAGDT